MNQTDTHQHHEHLQHRHGDTRPLDAVQTLMIDGASCGSCVAKIEQSLKAVPGVKTAEMNFADRTVAVTGDAPTTLLISAVEKAGYNASASAGLADADALEEKEQADQAYYRRLMLDMGIALGIGIPLMLYGLIVGDMSVTTTAERWAWLGVGILTLGVMIFSGRHFYTGAWQSFRNHSANMDTLIALGTGTAWLYSMVVILLPSFLPEMARHVYFEATAMIIGLINLGLALELKARAGHPWR